jgi:hypothetical protein
MKLATQNSIPWVASRFSLFPLLPSLLHLICWRASTLRTEGLQNHRPPWSCTERGWIRFFRSILHECLIAYPSLSSWLIHLFTGWAPTVVVYNATSSRRSGVFATPSTTIVTEEEALHIFSLTMSYMLDLVIYIGMILLDLLQCLICIIMIDLFSTFHSNDVCNSLFMFMIYF